MWKMSLSHFPASFENKIKGDRARQYLHVTDVKNSCCLLLAGNCLESYRTCCVCVCVHSSVCPDTTLCLLGMNLCWLAIMRLGETKEWDPNRHSAFWSFSIARVCCHYVFNPRLNQGWLPSGLGLQLNRLLLEKPCARQNPAWSVFTSLQCLSVSDRLLFICGSSRPSWPRCPDSTPPPPPAPLPPLAESKIRGWFTSLTRTRAVKLQVSYHPVLISRRTVIDYQDLSINIKTCLLLTTHAKCKWSASRYLVDVDQWLSNCFISRTLKLTQITMDPHLQRILLSDVLL